MKQEQIRFAISENGTDWKALNNNQPILDSKVISNTGGVRDPHILRGADGKSYYMVATDMFTHKDGWGFNPGIVLMRSDNLTDWTHSAIDFTKTYPEMFGNVQWVWAPQTFYDAKAGKYLVYFTVKFKHNEYLDFYCAYTNADFTALEHEPVFMFRADYGAIDADIIYNNVDGLYHLFFKGNTKDKNGKEYINGIKQAVSTSLQGPWYEDRTYIDAYAGRIAVEGSGIFKLNPKDSKSGKDEYILMYDLYHNGRYEFQRTTDLFHFTSHPESFTKDFFPRHGTVLPITKKELKVLKAKWGE
ncbi:MAG: glycoside hydrolase family 43 protein [Bacteroidaceae bacterium]|nr:glycoside hydrolase family 43 protein [Bacteroidaceae bacterium]